MLPDPGAPIQAAAIGSTVYVGTLLWLPIGRRAYSLVGAGSSFGGFHCKLWATDRTVFVVIVLNFFITRTTSTSSSQVSDQIIGDLALSDIF